MSAPITRRQGEVLDHLCSGLTNKEIGVQLGVCEATIKTHMSLAMRKLGGRTRAQTAAIWMQARPTYLTLWEAQDDGLTLDIPDAVVASPTATWPPRPVPVSCAISATSFLCMPPTERLMRL